MSAAEFSIKLRVYIEDTDAGGIVYYVNYLKFMERARTEFMRAQGFGKDFIFNHDLMFVVREVALKYRGPARLDDELQATARIASPIPGTSRSQTAEVASGVMSRGPIPVPPVVTNQTGYGTLQIQFHDCNHLTMDYVFEDPALTNRVEMTRAAVDNVDFCIELAAEDNRR